MLVSFVLGTFFMLISFSIWAFLTQPLPAFIITVFVAVFSSVLAVIVLVY
jgi:hypothetical protein